MKEGNETKVLGDDWQYPEYQCQNKSTSIKHSLRYLLYDMHVDITSENDILRFIPSGCLFTSETFSDGNHPSLSPDFPSHNPPSPTDRTKTEQQQQAEPLASLITVSVARGPRRSALHTESVTRCRIWQGDKKAIQTFVFWRIWT